MKHVYIVFIDETLHMCYDIIVFDSVHETLESAETRKKEIGKKAYIEKEVLKC